MHPDLLEDDLAWENVGIDVRDKLSTGQLKAWGRIIREDGIESILGQNQPLTPIASEYWERADFSYIFLAEGQEKAEHTYPENRILGPRNHSYGDVRVNKQQAIKIWPKKRKK